SVAHCFQQFSRSCRTGFAVEPIGANLLCRRLVVTPWPVGFQIALRRVCVSSAIEQSISERTEHRLGVLPANRLQRAPTVGDVNGFVSDLAKIARTIATENFENFMRAGGSGQAGNSDVGGRLIPVLHRFSEGLTR